MVAMLAESMVEAITTVEALVRDEFVDLNARVLHYPVCVAESVSAAHLDWCLPVVSACLCLLLVD